MNWAWFFGSMIITAAFYSLCGGSSGKRQGGNPAARHPRTNAPGSGGGVQVQHLWFSGRTMGPMNPVQLPGFRSFPAPGPEKKTITLPGRCIDISQTVGGRNSILKPGPLVHSEPRSAYQVPVHLQKRSDSVPS